MYDETNRESVADAPVPNALPLGVGSNNTPALAGQTVEDAYAPGKKTARRPKPKALLRNKTMVARVTWSKISRPEADLDTLIAAGRVELKSFDIKMAKWQRDGKPACGNCGAKHAPPCLSRDDVDLLRLKRALLRSYEEEQKRVNNLEPWRHRGGTRTEPEAHPYEVTANGVPLLPTDHPRSKTWNAFARHIIASAAPAATVLFHSMQDEDDTRDAPQRPERRRKRR